MPVDRRSRPPRRDYLILEQCDEAASFAKSTGSVKEDALRQGQAEVAAFLISLVTREARAAIVAKDAFENFMDTLATHVARGLQAKGVDLAGFQELLGKRCPEYSRCRIQSWDESESRAGELFWEFGKIISTTLCGFPNLIIGTSLATLMLRTWVDWKVLRELIPES
jgi:hypothetical protein